MKDWINVLVISVCTGLLVILAVHDIYQLGYERGLSAPKKCAMVEGERVVSSTADTCTYASSYGFSTKRRAAL